MKAPVSFAEREERRRKLLSVGLTAGIYAIGLGAGILMGILNPSEKAYSNTTVVLNLAGPDAAELGLGSVNPSETGEQALVTEAPAPATSSSDAAKVADAKTASLAKPIENTTPEPKAAPSTAAKAQAATTPDTVPVAATPGAPSEPAAQATEPETPYVPGPRGPGSRISSTNSSVLVPGQGDVPWAQGNSVTIRKAEKGNSVETTLGGAEGTVGQSLYVPIYDSMPLPRTVPVFIYDAIPDEVQPPNLVIATAQARKNAFLSFYRKDGDIYRLISDVPLDRRGRLWVILEDAGYDLENAEYKQNRALKPVVIGFTVTKDKQLRGADILQSSGDADIDQAVLYSFKQSAFWNRTGETVPGRFTYRF